MSRVPTVRKADLDRVFAALKRAGLDVAGIVVRPGGDVVITPGPAAQALTGPGAGAQLSDLEAFRAEKAKRGGRAS